MDLKESDMNAALESLISEAGSPSAPRAKILGKRSNEEEYSPTFT